MSGGRSLNRRRGGPLAVIAAFLAFSAALRFGAEAAPVLAREATEAMKEAPVSLPPDPSTANRDAGALLAALQQREAVLAEREQALENRMKALQVAGRAIDTRLAQLKDAEARLRETVALVDGASERDIARLTEVYEQMKPKETARVFQQMAPEFAAGFLARMRPEVSAQVLAGMDPQTAYSVSVIMAGRNVGVPTQ